jgi:hypothetical protein
MVTFARSLSLLIKVARDFDACAVILMSTESDAVDQYI